MAGSFLCSGYFLSVHPGNTVHNTAAADHADKRPNQQPNYNNWLPVVFRPAPLSPALCFIPIDTSLDHNIPHNTMSYCSVPPAQSAQLLCWPLLQANKDGWVISQSLSVCAVGFITTGPWMPLFEEEICFLPWVGVEVETLRRRSWSTRQRENLPEQRRLWVRGRRLTEIK